MNPKELIEFRAEFAKLGIVPDSNRLMSVDEKTKLTEWLLSYPELEVGEIARATGYSFIQIYRIRKRLKIKDLRVIETDQGIRILRMNRQVKFKPYVNIRNRNPRWVIDQFVNKQLSIIKIHRMTGYPVDRIRLILRRNHIPLRGYPQSNPCRNREWLIEHYYKQQLSQDRCAKIAGVSRYTIGAWLIHFNLPSRDQYQANLSKSKWEANGFLGSEISPPVDTTPTR